MKRICRHAVRGCLALALLIGPLPGRHARGREAASGAAAPVPKVVKAGKLRIVVTEAPKWSALFKRYEGWTGADGIYAIPLSGYEGPGKADKTKTLLVFGDSFIGKVDPKTMARRKFRMVNNTLALLDGARPVADRIRFIWPVAPGGRPLAVFVPTTPKSRGRKSWYWLQDGVCLRGNVYLLPMMVERTPAGGHFGFRSVGVAMIRIPVTAAGPQLKKHTQIDTPFRHVNETRTLYFGAGIMPNTVAAGAPNPDGYVYVYGRYQKAEIKLAAARVKAADFEDFAKWRFWDGRDWSADIARTAPLGRGGPELSVTPVPSGPLKGKYLMVSMHVERYLYIRIGESPVGPFGPRINIHHTTEPDAGQEIYTYNAKAHPNLSAPGQWLISYNVNSTNFRNLVRNADIYRPRFLTVRFEAAGK